MIKFESIVIAILITVPIEIIGQSEWNLNFEIWDTANVTPALWHDTTIVENRTPLFPPQWHYRPDHIAEGTGLAQTTDGTEGNYAVAMSGYYQYEIMRIISGENPSNPGWSIDFRPLKLTGDYKAILLGDCDSLRVYVDIFLTSFNQLTNTRETIGQANAVLKEATSYEQFELDIEYENGFSMPDTVIIVLAKRRFGFDNPPDCLECSHVFFDNLNLTETVSIQEPEWSKDVKIFPNPARKNITIQSKCKGCNYNILVISSTGQKIVKQGFLANEDEINITNLAKGFYFVKLGKDKSREYVYRRLIIQ